MDGNLPLLDISFDSSLKVFMPGEFITGSVKFSSKNDLTIEMLSVYLKGEYYIFKGDEEVIEVFSTSSCPLDLKGAGEGNVEMPFTFIVKPDAPASIATPLGGVRYRVYASLFYKNLNRIQKADIEKSEYLSVVGCKKIKDDQIGRKECSRERGFFTCCLGLVSGDLEVVKTSILCGHQAVINACVINTTSNHIFMTSLSLVQRVERTKDGRVFKNKVSTKERGSIMPGKRQVWLAEKFLIPPLPPSGSYSFFDVSYSFVMEIQKSMTKTIKIKIPITIGNIPHDCEVLPSTWNDPSAGLQFWCSYLEESIKDVGFRPLYVSYVTE